MSNTEFQNEEILRNELIGKVSSETYHKNYLVEAGAGAGKTYVMTNRIVNQLLDGEILPEHLAAITFTEKATQEMLMRIDTELIERLQKTVKESGAESAEAARLRNLIDNVDLMQVSTIHSFCRKLLMTMPYESALGPEFEVIEDITSYAGDFFDRTIETNPSIFDYARQITGVSYEDLKHNFVNLCETGADIVCADADQSAINGKFEKMTAIASAIHLHLADAADMGNVKSIKTNTVQKLLPQIREVLRLKDRPENEFIQILLKTANPLIKANTINKEAIVRVLPGIIAANRATVGAQVDKITEIWGEVIHAVCMKAIKELIVQYQKYKRENRVASQNDLLLCARDMLRNSAEARSYFHNRYQAIYVDEMQDTDLIQAQILFYLTTDEANYDPDDWRKCKPVPGSLFLVGDPKQAIYRFRGADISVYLVLKELFNNGVGEYVKLHYNYRSSCEIVDYVDKVFERSMNGGDYQAEYSPMDAVHGSSTHSRIIGYTCEKGDDAKHVAAFIAETVAARTIVGRAGKEHEACYSDFMILTRLNKSTEQYVHELGKYGIPCNMSGSKNFSDVQPIARANIILQYMLDQKDETKLALVLVKCYGISLPALRDYRQRVGKLTINYLAVKKALLEENGQISAEFEQIFYAMTELVNMCSMIGKMPAMTVIENVFFKSTGIWRQDAAVDRSSDYAMVTQYLQKLRETGFLSFATLAANAVELSEGKAERELLLEENENCVKIMNLHKAKGLEAEIVILAYDTSFKSDAAKHTFFDGNTMKIHSCFTRKDQYGEKILATESGWSDDDGPENEETSFLKAEIIRLWYVAATRAKTCLFVNMNKGCAWEQIGKAIYDPDDVQENNNGELYTDEDCCWEQAIRSLYRAQSTVAMSGADTPEAPVVNVSSADMEKELFFKASTASLSTSVYVTPSKLEGNQRRHLGEEEKDIALAETANDEKVDVPHGADWGTIMHRVLELAVKAHEYNIDAVRQFAKQAVSEVLGDCSMLSARQHSQMVGAHLFAEGETIEEYLVNRAAKAAAFLCDTDSELRKLTDCSACYTELPFVLQEKDRTTSIASAVSSIIGEENDRPININGVIDLAVKTDDAWIIVDYKTDILLKNETEELFVNRLKYQYTSQLLVYREVLNRLGKGGVEKVYICSLALGGRLIPVL